MIRRDEANQIVNWVLRELANRSFAYTTDGKLDFNKSTVGTISGTMSGGQLAPGGIWDYHVNENAQIEGTKIRVATLLERGTQLLGYNQNELGSTAVGSGASLIGVSDAEGDFTSTNVEDVLHELLTAVGAVTFLALTDTPSTYDGQYYVPTINYDEDGLEFRPREFIDAGRMTENYDGAITLQDDFIDGGAITLKELLDGGTFV